MKTHEQRMANLRALNAGLRARLDNHAPRTYHRDVLIEVITYHQTVTGPPPFAFTCMCGWRELGMSHAAHVADVYESSLEVRT